MRKTAPERHQGRLASGRNPVPYAAAAAAQRALADLRREGRIGDLLWLLEHPPTITWGSSGGAAHLLAPARELAARGIELVRSERGGDVTFHEPGQLVGYPIVDLSGAAGTEIDLHDYLRRLEEGLIAYLAGTGLRADRIPGRTGVWIAEAAPPRKIAAIGIKARRRVASHGFALNVENGLGGFDLIVPCGIRDAAVTSLARELGGAAPAWEDVARGVHRALEAALGRRLVPVVGDEGLRLAAG